MAIVATVGAKLGGWIGLMVLLIAVRIECLMFRLFSNDESFTWRMCQYCAPEILQHLPADAHPPLHYLMWKAWSACCGDSLPSLRSLSIVFGVLSLVVVCQVSREVVPAETPPDDNHDRFKRSLLLVGVLATLLVGQLYAGSNARMYSLGALLAALSAWALWRALQSDSWWSRWWLGYALATTAFCYTHYFAFFAVLGQASFVLGTCVTEILAGARRKAVQIAAGGLYAFTIAGILYMPWIPTFMAQKREVEEGWWVPAMTPAMVYQVGFEWMTGMKRPDSWATPVWSGLLAVLIGWTLWNGGAAAWFFFLQAFVPWLCLIILYVGGKASLLQLHYLVFAQIALIGLWGVAWRILPGGAERLLLLLVLGLPCIWGLFEYRSQLPNGPPALAEAAAFLKEHSGPDDWFIADDHRKINLFRYYTTQAGLSWVTVKACVSPLRKGHIVHIASLAASEIYWSEADLWSQAPARIWRVSHSPDWTNTPVPGRKLVLRRVFEGGGGTKFAAALYEPD